VQLGEASDGGKGAKPPTASLFKSMNPETVTLDDALRLLTLPRTVGHDPANGEEITAANGRYGPYVKRGSDTRSLQSEDELFTLDLVGALEVLAQPKRGRGEARRGPLRILGADPATGWQVEVRDGKFGPYVTDGGVNASLRREDSVERITVERASTLLAERRERLESEGKDVKPGRVAAAAGGSSAGSLSPDGGADRGDPSAGKTTRSGARPADGSVAKKATARKPTAKKATAKKATTNKATAKKAAKKPGQPRATPEDD
jgi:DNA topoisomerase-1